MNLAICSLASGSSGNCYLIMTERTAVLVDAGISAKQTKLRLEKLGLSLANISAVLVTHEHSDHIKALAMLLKQSNARLYTNRKTYEASGLDPEKTRDRAEFFNTGDVFRIGNMEIKSFHLSHDAADPTGYSFFSGGKKLTIVTDTGLVTEEIRAAAEGSDILVLESNYDESMLRAGRYPWFLKQRISGLSGHLSNDEASAELIYMLEGSILTADKERLVLFAHLSKENNFPEMVMLTASNALAEKGFTAGNKIKIETLSRTEQSPLYWI